MSVFVKKETIATCLIKSLETQLKANETFQKPKHS